jgi:hypothetical protein
MTLVGNRAEVMGHAISLIKKAIVQQVNGANDWGRIYSRPALSQRASSGVSVSRKNYPPPQPRVCEEAAVSGAPPNNSRNRQNPPQTGGAGATRHDARNHINELQATRAASVMSYNRHYVDFSISGCQDTSHATSTK